MSTTAKPIQATAVSDCSWILSQWGTRLGLLSNTGNGFKLLIEGECQQFDSIEHMCDQHKWRIEWAKPVEPEPAQTVLLGHLPIKHQAAHDVEQGSVISYSKQAGSSVRFAAGYWGLRFSHAWTAAFCPKISTLDEYEHVGPFSSKLELNTVLAQRNKTLNKETV